MILFLYYILIFFFGAAVFSFLSVVIYRLPRKLSFVKGRSFCPSCETELRGCDMIPVLSWLMLGGKCRYCGARISVRHPFFEALGGLSAVLCIYLYGMDMRPLYLPSLQVLIVFGLLCVLYVIAMIDLETMEIPNELVVAAAVPALLSVWAFPETGVAARAVGMVCVSGFMLLMSLFVAGAFGGGDIKLMAVLGFFLGWRLCLLAFFFAVLTGGGYGAILLIRRKVSRKDHFAFGPFLCLGTAAAMLAGERILSWYLGLLW